MQKERRLRARASRAMSSIIDDTSSSSSRGVLSKKKQKSAETGAAKRKRKWSSLVDYDSTSESDEQSTVPVSDRVTDFIKADQPSKDKEKVIEKVVKLRREKKVISAAESRKAKRRKLRTESIFS